MSVHTSHQATDRSGRVQPSAGFTRAEQTIAILIIAILCAMAIPRLIDLSSTTREAVARGAAASLRSAADMAHYRWSLHSSDMGSVTVTLPDRTVAHMWHGYPDAGNCCAVGKGIEALIDVTGLYVNRLDNAQTRLEVIGAPTQAQCSATYTVAAKPGDTYSVLVDSSGC
jgi:MSHA pilin protein MshA